jgi:prevent-host-death family protein
VSETVALRELRQHLSRYVARTARGERFDVTDRGGPVARLVPPSIGEPWLDALVADGAVRPADRRSPVFPQPQETGVSISEVLEAGRAGGSDRWRASSSVPRRS